jgi:eukaryotic-like serine/threonine-protein kinase
VERPLRRGDVEYRLIKRLAAGGMADLFLAQAYGRRGYERTVVVKTARADAGPRTGDLERALFGEAEVGRAFRHPNLVELLDAQLEGTRPHLIFEFVFGRDVAQIRDRIWAEGRPVPLFVIAAVMREVLCGLAYVHSGAGRQSLEAVHRDVSPQNILVSFEGQVKLADFGLAKAAFLDGGTSTEMVKGKAAYMAPEQLTERSASPRSDVFGLGVVLWELLTGRRLFYREDDAATARAVVREPVPWPRNPGRPVPLRWAWLCWRATRRNRRLRFESSAAMLRAVESVDGRSRREAREALAEWMRGLFAERLQRRERHAASFRDPVERRKVLDAGFELTPEVTETRAPRRPTGMLRPRRSRGWWPWILVAAAAAAGVIERVVAPVGGTRIQIRSSGGSGGTVRVNGRPVGNLPLPPVAVEPGRHRVEVVQGKEEVETREVWVREGAIEVVEVP